jgi:NifU-like protein involved in Fe-S cluster formation
MEKYGSKVMEHFFNPKNPGEVENPSGEGFSGDQSERIFMHFTIRVEDDRIIDAKFQCYTCVVAVAACSFLTEMIKGIKIEEAERISPETLASELGEIPPERMDRCCFAVKAMRNAIESYRNKIRLLAKSLNSEDVR